MNFSINQIPDRSSQPRSVGLTMIMDKGLSVRETEDFIDGNKPYIDIVKLGFGSAMITPRLADKLKLFAQADIPVYFGGTLLEAFLVRNDFKGYLDSISRYGVKYAEISDGSITLAHDEKCNLIKRLKKHVTVISEVGSKEEGIIIHPTRWIEMMQKELDAGVWKVIAEARESGTVGIYRPNGKAHVMLINKIVNKIPVDKIIWEAPLKPQQVYLIKLFGANVNLGNIAPTEVIALESLRLGLRSDTFFQFVKETNKEISSVS
ncbi:MAG: phosphosulfolactate synthase [Bacteroidota bacterium]|nr:phosphosulfolactate synthase [Bacteroidota bacterium]